MWYNLCSLEGISTTIVVSLAGCPRTLTGQDSPNGWLNIPPHEV